MLTLRSTFGISASAYDGPVGRLTASGARAVAFTVRVSRTLVGVVAAAGMVLSTMAAPALAFHGDPAIAPEPPFVVCQDQTYALCIAGSCFIYNGVAYCGCTILKGNSIS